MMKNLFARSWQAISSLLPSSSPSNRQWRHHERSAQSQARRHSHWQRTMRVLSNCRNTRIHLSSNCVQSDLELSQLWKSHASLDSSTSESAIEGYYPSLLNITAHTLDDGVVQTKLISRIFLAEIKRRRPSRTPYFHQTTMWSLTAIPPRSKHGCWLGWQDKMMLFNNSPAAKTYIQSLLPKSTTEK